MKITPVCKFSLLFVCALLCGCVAATKSVSTDSLQKIRNVHVVPLESHALLISDDSAFVGSKVASLGLIPRSNFSNQRGLLLAGTLLMLAELNSPEREQRQAAASAQAEQILRKNELWSPNVEVAREVVQQLTVKGINAAVADNVLPLPPLQADEKAGTNWRPIPWNQAAIWYGDENKTDRYRSFASDSSMAVIEVGISVYSIELGMFMAQVHLKLIDPATGTILGRSRGYDYYDRIRGEDLWSNDGARFKALFAQLIKKSVAEAVRDIGWPQG